MNKNDFSNICKYYLTIKYNFSIFDIEEKLRKYIIQYFRIYESEDVNNIIEDVVNKYKNDDR